MRGWVERDIRVVADKVSNPYNPGTQLKQPKKNDCTARKPAGAIRHSGGKNYGPCCGVLSSEDVPTFGHAEMHTGATKLSGRKTPGKEIPTDTGIPDYGFLSGGIHPDAARHLPRTHTRTCEAVFQGIPIDCGAQIGSEGEGTEGLSEDEEGLSGDEGG
jgi:hypothetical protein